MSLHEFQKVGTSLRATRDLIVLSLLEIGSHTVDDIQTEFQFITGEEGSVAPSIRRLLQRKHVRYPSTGRELPGVALNDRRKYYSLAPEGKRVLKALRWLLKP